MKCQYLKVMSRRPSIVAMKFTPKQRMSYHRQLFFKSTFRKTFLENVQKKFMRMLKGAIILNSK